LAHRVNLRQRSTSVDFRRRAAEQRDELATSQLIEWHSISVPRREEQKAEA